MEIWFLSDSRLMICLLFSPSSDLEIGLWGIHPSSSIICSLKYFPANIFSELHPACLARVPHYFLLPSASLLLSPFLHHPTLGVSVFVWTSSMMDQKTDDDDSNKGLQFKTRRIFGSTTTKMSDEQSCSNSATAHATWHHSGFFPHFSLH